MVIQSPERSGCLHCATSALDQGKDVFVHSEGGLGGGSLEGGIASLVEMGAPPTLHPSVSLPPHTLGGEGESKCRRDEQELVRCTALGLRGIV